MSAFVGSHATWRNLTVNVVRVAAPSSLVRFGRSARADPSIADRAARRNATSLRLILRTSRRDTAIAARQSHAMRSDPRDLGPLPVPVVGEQVRSHLSTRAGVHQSWAGRSWWQAHDAARSGAPPTCTRNDRAHLGRTDPGQQDRVPARPGQRPRCVDRNWRPGRGQPVASIPPRLDSSNAIELVRPVGLGPLPRHLWGAAAMASDAGSASWAFGRPGRRPGEPVRGAARPPPNRPHPRTFRRHAGPRAATLRPLGCANLDAADPRLPHPGGCLE
jgi:hypothetical protein